MPKKLPIENGKIKVRSWHWYTVLIWICGLLMPPIAVLIRFGICKDLFINIILTIMGYIPGHAHNWFIQNIRDNTQRGRSPKWAVRYGLVEDGQKKQRENRTWASRYHERSSANPYDDPDAPAEDTWGNSVYDSNHIPGSLARPAQPMNGDADVYEPSSARSLDRPQTYDDDSDDDFFGADHGTGEAPGGGDASRRRQGGHAKKVKGMVTGGNSKKSKKMQQEGRERFEREERMANGYGYDHRAPLEDDFLDPMAPSTANGSRNRLPSRASSGDAHEINPDDLRHDF